MKNVTSLKGVKVIAFADAALRLLDGKEKVVGVVPLPAGPVDLTPYDPLTAAGIVEFTGLLVVSSPTGKLKVIRSEKRYSTAADPDFVPSTEYREKRQMEKMVEMVVRRQDEKARRERLEQERLRREMEAQEADAVVEEAPTPVEDQTPTPVEPPKDEADAESPAPTAAE